MKTSIITSSFYGRFLITVILSFFFFGSGFCQNTMPANVVTLKTFIVKDSVGVNGKLYVEVEINIKDGWHINANKPSDDYLTPTEIKFVESKDFNLINIKYPPPILKKLDFSDTELALYESQAIVRAVFYIKGKKSRKGLVIQGELLYQPCNNQTCLFPVKKTFEIKTGK